MPQECCSTERKTITTGFCVALTANHEQFFLSGCPSLLSGSAVNPDVRDEAISLWSWQPRGRLLPQQVSSQEAHCLKPEADCRTGLLVGVCYQPQIKSWLRPAQQTDWGNTIKGALPFRILNESQLGMQTKVHPSSWRTDKGILSAHPRTVQAETFPCPCQRRGADLFHLTSK